MGTTSDKLTYLNTTKTQLKGMINYGLDENNKITNETTFRDYVKSIFKAFLESLNNPDTLFTNLPKKSQEGANITLNDTANAPMRIKLSASEISQDTTTGKNIFNLGSLSGTTEGNVTLTQDSDGGFILNGTANGAGRFKVALSTDISSAVTMYLKTPTADGNIMLSLRDSDSIQLSNIRNNNNTLVVGNYTPSGNPIHYLELGHITSGVQYNNYKFYVMVVNGTYSSSNIGNYEPYTNGASPNPSYTQDIHTISGNNKLVVNGKNLYNGEISATNQRLSTSTGGGYTTTGWSISNYVAVLPNTTYTLSTEERIFCDEYDNNKTFIKGTAQIYGVTTPLTITTTSTTKFLRFDFPSENVTKAMIEVRNTATEYQPYVSQEADINLGDIEYCKIGNYEDEFIRTNGLNKLPNNTTTQTISNVTFTKEDGGSIKLSGTSNSYADFYFVGSASQYIDLGLEAGTYNLNGCTGGSGTTYMLYAVQNRNGTLYYYQNYTSEGINISIQDGDTFRIFIRVMSGQTVNNVTIYPMLNEGTTALPYEPYGTNEWYIKKSINKVVLDGTEDWTSIQMNNVYGYYTSINNILAPTNNSEISKGKSNLFIATTPSLNWTTTNGQSSYAIITNSTNVRFTKGETTGNLDNFKNWLNTNNIILYYALATPTYIQITGTLAEQLENIFQKLKSFKGTTNISQVNNDLPFVLNVQALENLE